MKKILRIRESVKIREAKVKEIEGLPLNPANVNITTELIQALIPVGLRNGYPAGAKVTSLPRLRGLPLLCRKVIEQKDGILTSPQ
jgi:hypothetical protein